MSDLRIGRSTLLLATCGFLAVAATLFVPAVFVLGAVFGVTVLVLGLMSVRTRVARIGLLVGLVALPGITFIASRCGRETRVQAHATEVFFSPNGGCTDAVVSQINSAKQSVLVQAYYLTNKRIGPALIAAHRRGVRVRIILDSRAQSSQYTEATYLSNAGLEPLIDAGHKIAHNKVMIVDATTVVTGSMNFSGAGEGSNAENLLVIHDQALAATYTNNWNVHAKHSLPYTRTSQALGSSFDVPTEEE